jgi:DNA-binding NarL/FixJ family response regulator
MRAVMEKTKVLVADDHPAFREGLYWLLDKQTDIEVIATAVDGDEAVSLAKELLPDVVVIDVAMPNLNGIEAAKQINVACPNTAILILSAFDYEQYMIAALQAGAAGYLLKSIPMPHLINAIRLLHVGEGVFDLNVGNNVLRRLALESEKMVGPAGLSHQEVRVLKLGAKGLSNKEIASELVLSERTIKTHMINIFRKLGVNSRTEAVSRAVKDGWLILDDLN